jgi:glycosyltransferase involved in cell wall biosynthesis
MNTFMLEDKDIVCIALPAWDGNYEKSTVKIMSQLAKRNRVLYIEYAYTYKDILSTWFGKQKAPVSRILGTSNRLRKISLPENSFIHVLTLPPVSSVNYITDPAKHRRLLQSNGKKILKSVLQAIRKLNMKAPVVINAFNPFVGLPLLNQLGETAALYYCYDEISECAWTKNHGKQLEEEYIGKADGVIVSSDGLMKAKSELASNIYLVKNGVDFAHFNKAADLRNKNKTADITVGYVGSLDNRIDYELLAYLAEKLTDVKFEFVGRILEKNEVSKLDKLPNTKFWDAKRLEELPEFLKRFDAGIIPFVKNKTTAGVYPMKINEYLAAGVPVVSTDFAVFPEFGSFVTTASSHEAFTQAVIENLCNDTPEKRKQRIAVAQGNSWEKRGEQFEAAIVGVLQTKGVLSKLPQQSGIMAE